jgi:hypothetical protein
MPTSNFLSKSKMQAWVMSNNAAAKPAAAAEAQGHTNDSSGSPQKGHVYHGQPTPSQAALAPENSPPRTQNYQSRMPIINHANNTRNAAALAARINATRAAAGQSGQQASHSRDGSINAANKRVISTEPLQNAQGEKPFWDCSTVDGSVFSETASAGGSRDANQTRILDPSFKSRTWTRQRDSDSARGPFIIGDNGIIELKESPLTRSTSTPDARAKASSSKGTRQDADRYAEDGHYQSAPDRSPPNTLTHRGARLPLRSTKRETFPERTSYPSAQSGRYSPVEQAYQAPRSGQEYAPRDEYAHLRVPIHDAHRSTVFENIDTPVASHPNLPESDLESSDHEDPEEQPTPKPKSKQPVNRQLFTGDSKTSKDRNSLRESAMPRSTPEKRHSSAKKRPIELDYDDRALAEMDYNELKGQAFDYDPAHAEPPSGQHPAQGTLSDKLGHFMDKDAKTQATFFNTMSINDWDNSGDWFLEKFEDVMHRLRDARKTKRKMVDEFEDEIAEREEAVRNKIINIGQTLDELRNEGEVMMKGKALE